MHLIFIEEWSFVAENADQIVMQGIILPSTKDFILLTKMLSFILQSRHNYNYQLFELLASHRFHLFHERNKSIFNAAMYI